jgi:uncharacterized protein (TIGR02597 family)
LARKNVSITSRSIFAFFLPFRTMKSLFVPILVAFAIAADAQTVTTPVVGGITLNLAAGTNFVGFALQPILELQTEVTIHATQRNRVFLPSTVTLTDGQYGSGAQATHVVEFIDAGVAEGMHLVIAQTIATGRELVLTGSVNAAVADGAKVRIWRLWTLGDVFGATNTAGLLGGATSGAADLVMVPSGTDFVRYFYSTGGAQGTGWRLASGGTVDQAGVRLPFGGGLVIQTLASRALVLAGQVKTGKTRVTLQTGRNYVANLCPVNAGGSLPSAAGLTLSNSGMQSFLTAGKVSALADLVLIWNGTGYNQFYYATGGLVGTGWRRVGAGSTDQGSVPMPDGAFVIQRRGAPTEVLLSQGNY